MDLAVYAKFSPSVHVWAWCTGSAIPSIGCLNEYRVFSYIIIITATMNGAGGSS